MSDAVTWQLWDGKVVPTTATRRVAFDTETTVVDLSKDIPDGVLLTLWGGVPGTPVAIVPVERWAEAIQCHLDAGVTWVGHNVNFDFHVMWKALKEQGRTDLVARWEDAVEKGFVFCTALLDGVVRLASGEVDLGSGADAKKPIRNLEKLTLAYDVDCAPPQKASVFRMRFAELLDEPDWTAAHIDEGFWRYAAQDCVATWCVAERLLEQAWAYHNKTPREKLHPKADEWGPLTARLQLLGAIALADISRRGFRVDVDRAWREEARLRVEYQSHLTWLDEHYPGLLKKEDEAPARKPRKAAKKTRKKKGAPLVQGELFAVVETPESAPVTPAAPPKKAKRKGRRVTSAKTQTAAMDHKRLAVILEDVAADLGVEVPRTETGKLSRKADDWVLCQDKSEFVRRWSRVKELEKTLAFMVLFRNLPPDDPIVRSRYVTLVRSGRSASQNPNAQNMPKEEWFRGLFIPREGNLLYTCDFAAIELRTLSASCEKWQGRSELGKVIRSGKDPHCYTAAMVIGEPYEKVKAEYDKEKAKGWPKDKLKVYSGYRQSSKAILFGLGGGLGANRLVAYAKLNYGVDMTLEEATHLRAKIMYEVYPELSNEGNGWLATDTVGTLARNLELPFDVVFDAAIRVDDVFSRLGICLERVLRGAAVKANGQPYSPKYVQKLWAFAGYLAALSPVEKINKLVPRFNAGYDPADELGDLFFLESALTTTGRIRTGVQYTERCNGPFQGLAADGAKLGLWRLWRAGVEAVGFVHDEIIAEVPADKAKEQGQKIDEILVSSMEEVLEGFPVAVEGHADVCWSK